MFNGGSNNDAFDPLTLIFKLYVLSFKPVKTKISICSNSIIINEPNFSQGLSRNFYYRSHKNDVDVLTLPILFACSEYINKTTNRSVLDTRQLTDISLSDDHQNAQTFDLSNPQEKYLFIFHGAIDGLKLLKQTYEGDKITHTLDKHINGIKTYLNGNTSVGEDTLNSGAGKLKQVVYNNLKEVWTEERLQIAFQLVHQITIINIHKEEAIKTLENFLHFIDLQVHDIISGLS